MVALQPSLILSGHHHESLLFKSPKTTGDATHLYELAKIPRQAFNFSLATETLYDIAVPTCSYRMGKKKYGFGALTIG